MQFAPRVVVLRPGALGDALLALPALAALRRRWPTAHITLAARPDVLALAQASGLADDGLPFDDPMLGALWQAQPPALTGEAAALFAGAGAVVAWVSDGDGTITRNLRALGVRQSIVAPGRPAELAPGDEPEHVVLYLLRTLAPLMEPAGLEDATPPSLAALGAWMPALVSPPGDAAHAERVMAEVLAAANESRRVAGAESDADGMRVVALHPGSGGAVKCWPEERFAWVAARLWRAGAVPLVVAGPADGAVVARLLAAYGDQVGAHEDAAEGRGTRGLPQPADPSPRDTRPAPSGADDDKWSSGVDPLPALPVARDLPVPVLAGLLARCRAFVGNDSGVSHLAGLVGCPTLALFGPSDPAVWAPVGRRVHVLRAPEGADGMRAMEALPVATVWATLQRMLGGESSLRN